MGYYDWEKIVAEKSDKELLRIYKERDREPNEKVKAVFIELKKRGLINSDEKIVEKSDKDDTIYDINSIKETRPNSGRAVFAQSIILLIATLDIISIFSSYLQYNLLVSIKEGAIIEEGVANSNDLREQTIAIVYIVFSVISTIVFILWFRRAYFNLHNRISNCSHTEGWAAGSWFVPVISLYRPYQIMKEIFIKTGQILKDRNKTETQSSTGTFIIGVWWTLWIITNYIGKYVMRTGFKAETINDYINSTIGDIVLSVLTIPLAVITVMIIRRHAVNEDLLYADEVIILRNKLP